MFPRLVVYLDRYSPTDFTIVVKLKRDRKSKWMNVARADVENVGSARKVWRALGETFSDIYNVEAEYVHGGGGIV